MKRRIVNFYQFVFIAFRRVWATYFQNSIYSYIHISLSVNRKDVILCFQHAHAYIKQTASQCFLLNLCCSAKLLFRDNNESIRGTTFWHFIHDRAEWSYNKQNDIPYMLCSILDENCSANILFVNKRRIRKPNQAFVCISIFNNNNNSNIYSCSSAKQTFKTSDAPILLL